VVSEPRVEPGELPKQGSAYAFEATVEIRPEIELELVRGLAPEIPETDEPEQEPVESHLTQWRESQAQLLEEEPEVKSAEGHIVVVSFAGSIEGEPFEGGSSDEAQFELGSGRAIPGFEDALVGLAVGDEHRFEVDFPEDYGTEEVAGKRATFEVKVLGLKRKELPELDDEFAKDVSDFDTLDELRADLQKRVDEGRAQERERVEREAVLDELVKRNPFPVPASLVDRQLAGRLERAVGQFANQLPQERLVELVERWREEWRPSAERDVALSFLLPAIAKAEGMEISDEEVDAEIAKLAEQQERKPAELKKAYREGGVLPGLSASLLERRVVEFLVAEASLSHA
jgi:trigger factor